jgi:hypothetical protein
MTKRVENIATTLRLPRTLYDHAKRIAELEQFRNVGDFIVNVVASHVRALERQAIDDAFRGMADDQEYQLEALRVVEEFGG